MKAVVILAMLFAQVAQTPRISGTDFMLDWKQYTGQRITVADCALLMVGASSVFCYPNPKKNPTAGFLIPGGDTLPRDDRKILLSGCTLFPPNCVGDVTGIAGDLLGQPTLKNPSSIDWTTKP